MNSRITPTKSLYIRILKVLLKTLTGIIAGFLILILLLIILIQTPPVQNILRKKAITFLSGKLHTPVEIGNIKLNFKGNLVINHFFIADQQKDTLLMFNKLAVGANPFALFKKHIIITSVTLSGAHGNYVERDSSGATNIDFILKAFSDTSRQPTPDKSAWRIDVRKIIFEQVYFNFHNIPDGSLMTFTIGSLDLNLSETNMNEMRFASPLINIENSRIQILTSGKSQSTAKKKEPAKKQKLFVSVQQILMNNILISYLDSAAQTRGIFKLGKLSVFPKDIDFEKQKIAINILQLEHSNIDFRSSKKKGSSSEPSDTTAQSSSWTIVLNHVNIGIDNIHLVNMVPNESLSYLSNISLSKILVDLNGNYQSPTNWGTIIHKFQFVDNRNGQQTSISMNPVLKKNLLEIQQLDFKTGSSHMTGKFHINLSTAGKTNIPDFQANFNILNTNDLASYLPSTIASKLHHGNISLTGKLSSEKQHMKGNGTLKYGPGEIQFITTYDNAKASDENNYMAGLTISKFDIGKLLNDTTLGPFSGNIHVRGQGFNPDTAIAKISVSVNSFYFKNNTYRNINLNGNLSRGRINATIESSEQALSLKVVLNGLIKHNRPDLNIKANISKIDLRELGFTNDTLAIAGNLSIWYKNNGASNFESHADTCRLTFITNKENITLNNKLSYTQKPDSTIDAEYSSEIATLSYNGNMGFQELPGLIQSYLKKYNPKNDTIKHNVDKYFSFSLIFNDLSYLSPVLPFQLKVPKNSSVQASLVNNRLNANVNFKQLSISTMYLENLNIKAESADSLLNFTLTSSSIHDSTHNFRDVNCLFKLNQGNLDTRIKFSDADKTPWFDFGLTAYFRKDEIEAKIREPLIINYDEWEVNNYNQLIYSNKRLTQLNILLKNGPKQISLVQDRQSPDKIQIGLQNLDISFFSQLYKGDTTSIGGIMSGKVDLSNIFGESKPLFDADITIQELVIAKQALGNLKLITSNSYNPDIINLNLDISSKQMNLLVNGKYALKENQPLNISLSANNFNIAGLAPFLNKYITKPSGFLNASLNLTGSLNKPSIDGSLGFNKVALFINSLQSGFKINGQELQFSGNRLNFPSFLVNDNAGNPLTIKGDVSFANLKKPQFQLQINAKKFQIYNSPSHLRSKETKAILTSDMMLTGNTLAPVLMGNIQIEEGSKLYYEMTKQGGDFSENGIIVFTKKQNQTAPPPSSFMQNLNLTANITLAKDIPITIITNPAKGESVNIKTGGTFTYSQLPLQSPRLTGKTDITSGQYIMNLTGLKKTFVIASGNSITWSGDIANPEFNIRAYHEVRASPLPILNQLQGASNNESPQNSSPIPFDVYVNFKGILSSMEFNFSIALPDEYQNAADGMVASRLQQINTDPSDVNVQALSLLLFGTFDPTNLTNIIQGANGTNILISNALNQFATEEIKFVNLHFDLESYDNSGDNNIQNARTELKTEASRKFFDERFDAKAGAGIVLQGDPKEQSQQGLNRVTPTFNLQYTFNKQRSLSIKTFRQDDYKGLVEGKVISNGAGIVFQKDYDHIFKKKSKKQKVKKIKYAVK